MSIRPIDLQVMLPKTSEVGRISNNNQERPEVMQQQFAESIHKSAQQDGQRVVQSHKSEQETIDKDGRGNSGEQKSSNNRKRNRKEKNEVDETKPKGMFDIKI